MPNHALDDAAMAAFWAMPRSAASIEHMGLLYDNGGSVAATPFQTKGKAGEVGGSFQIPQGSLRGLLHNHPLTDNARRNAAIRRLAPHDVETADKLGVPSYIGVGNDLLRYTPGGKDTHGEAVLGQIPVDEIRKLYIQALKR